MHLESNRPGDHDEDRFIARHCLFFLDRELLPPSDLFAADEEAGYVEIGVFEPRAWSPGIRWLYDPKTRQPLTHRRTGKVEIRLRPDAPEIVRQLYEARRASE